MTAKSNQAPVITLPPAQTVMAGQTYRYDVRATDPEGDPITFTLDSGPSGMVMDAAGRISWQPAAGDVRKHTVQVTARDSFGATDTKSFDVTVTADTQRRA